MTDVNANRGSTVRRTQRTALGLASIVCLVCCGSSGDANERPDAQGGAGADSQGGAGGGQHEDAATADVGFEAAGGSFSFGRPEVLADGLNHPQHIAVDASFVYVAAFGTDGQPNGVIARVPKSNGAASNVAIGQLGPAGIAVDAQRVYWTTYAGGALMASALAGGAATTLAANQDRPTDLVAKAGSLFWITNGSASQLWQLDQATGNSGYLSAVTLRSPSKVVANAESVFVSDEAGSRSLHLAQGSVIAVSQTSGTPLVLMSGLASPRGLALDDQRIYFTTADDGLVRSVPHAGGPATTHASGQPAPWSVAVDANYVYFTNRVESGTADPCANASGSVLAVPIVGGTPVILAQGLACPSSVVVDSTGVYWVNTSASGSLMRVAKG